MKKPTYEELVKLVQELTGALDDATDFMDVFTYGGMSHVNFGCACGYEAGDDGVEECTCEDSDEHPRIATKYEVLNKAKEVLGREF